MNIRKRLILPLLLLSPLATAEDFDAKAAVALKQTYAQHGGEEQARQQLMPLANKKLRFCTLCHGADGNSIKSAMPSLAGERAEYLLRRWYQMKEGHGESKTAVRVARRIDEEQMIALALYFEGVERVPTMFDTELAARGEPVFTSVCVECHRADGRGEVGMPVIAGQKPGYLTRTLVQFRDQEGWRHGSRMPAQIDAMSPIQLKAVAHYAASLDAVK